MYPPASATLSTPSSTRFCRYLDEVVRAGGAPSSKSNCELFWKREAAHVSVPALAPGARWLPPFAVTGP